MSKDSDNFRVWYVEPLQALELLPSGNGGFIAIATACFLYERYAVAILKSNGLKADNDGKISQLSQDFGVSKKTANAFWQIIRNGILHQGMPMQDHDLPRWGFHDNFPALDLVLTDNGPFLKVQPWKFTKKVLLLWETHFGLLQSSGSFPWATIDEVSI